ncbi:MAG: hypothetical protein Greene041619_243 [Candidatus Peregrinibacteria bacterium Greene0416_19]|nr:MAG: hypothetical protein Greene041619_243 [Candidatus Peregrinibacteria bacterium Greene0416_19]
MGESSYIHRFPDRVDDDEQELPLMGEVIDELQRIHQQKPGVLARREWTNTVEVGIAYFHEASIRQQRDFLGAVFAVPQKTGDFLFIHLAGIRYVEHLFETDPVKAYQEVRREIERTAGYESNDPQKVHCIRLYRRRLLELNRSWVEQMSRRHTSLKRKSIGHQPVVGRAELS